ncbi:hypothetical protein GNP82_09475 [Aliivibrio fischeri]|uniref:hypothetical protein n=1 Tax=Aliivibrio fischeri TaxID=668 RepID=UPI0012D93AEF|nr:hypothetical protein [Aliivibrio fischeri]MUK37782.1 hypothetical protein [Aliivibrio fischeri]MUL06568.1 hypothetical protein [Aliivibrio fischeri]
MAKPIQLGFMALIMACSLPAFAKGERYGIAANFKTIESTEYEQGMSGELSIISYGLVHTRPIDENNNRWRWLFGFNYLSDYIEAPANGVYQEVTNYEFRIVPQYALGNWWAFTPYVGAGLSLGYSQYGNRWKVDDEGYKYGNQLDDIDQFEVGAVLSFGTVIKLGSNPDAHLQIIPQASYIQPIYNDGLGGLELSVSLLF